MIFAPPGAAQAATADWKDVAGGIKDAVTAIAILVGGLVGIVKFRWFAGLRQVEQFMSMTTELAHAVSGDDVVLYVDVILENTGQQPIRGRECIIRVTPFAGGQALPAQVAGGRLPEADNDGNHLLLIDKGERSSFAYAVTVPGAVSAGATAYLVRVEYYSQKKLEGGRYLGWMQQAWYLPEGRKTVAAGAAPADDAGGATGEPAAAARRLLP